jgi:hypothetical protein
MPHGTRVHSAASKRSSGKVSDCPSSPATITGTGEAARRAAPSRGAVADGSIARPGDRRRQVGLVEPGAVADLQDVTGQSGAHPAP